ncbi:hypothetical protein BB561_002454 [Smittium simulii]|uniref:Uncharacterized protein n=1 Tax=Smittium simulii TaxID=133385 RepID=A0A2T9YQC9_9FUNG|nr:hypothetical protein BB561_002454 [Smittium simulii]
MLYHSMIRDIINWCWYHRRSTETHQPFPCFEQTQSANGMIFIRDSNPSNIADVNGKHKYTDALLETLEKTVTAAPIKFYPTDNNKIKEGLFHPNFSNASMEFGIWYPDLLKLSIQQPRALEATAITPDSKGGRYLLLSSKKWCLTAWRISGASLRTKMG